MATLIVRYPKPIRLKGTSYNHLMLHADKENIRKIANILSHIPINEYRDFAMWMELTVLWLLSHCHRDVD
jgi:ribosomal protein L20